MDDLYVECLVARKPNPAAVLIKGLTYGLTAVFILGGLFIHPFFFLGGIAGGLAAWLLLPMLSIEYEYLYVSRSVTIDKIYSREKRKNEAEYDLDKMEIFAEEGSARLDDYKNMKTVDRDYSSRVEGRPRWVMIVRDDKDVQRLYLEPSEDFVKAVRNQFPQKTFSKI